MAFTYSRIERSVVSYLMLGLKWTYIDDHIRERIDRFLDSGNEELPHNLIPYQKELKIRKNFLILSGFLNENKDETTEAFRLVEGLSEQEFNEFYRRYRAEQRKA